MSDLDTAVNSPAPKPTLRKVLAFSMAIVALSALGFVLARSLEWSLISFYVVLMIVVLVVNLVSLMFWNPDLIERRMIPGAGTKAWDIALLVLLFAPATIAMFVVALREPGDGVSGEPAVAWLLGLPLFVSGWMLIIWSMVVNPFFEKTVRIQTDHEHRVIDTGPYAYVRHPGYVGFIAWILSTPLLLASVWSSIPALLAVAALVIRTVFEDRMLQAELAGYATYANGIRFRLIPGVW
jgi:protein-S-isoprenylcysteine O-methyltransferase Ste14